MDILNKEKILEQAKLFIDDGKYDRAIKEYEKILLADPGDLKVRLRVAELYTKRKQIAEAIRTYKEVADSYVKEGFFLKAVTVYKNILRLNPSLIETNEQLAILYEKMGLVSDAIRQYDILASALEQKNSNEKALDIRAKMVLLNPKDGTSRVKLAELYQREGKSDEAINQYEEYVHQLEESGGNKSKLADLYEKVLSHRPDRHEMFRNMIEIFNELGDYKKIIKWMDEGNDIVESDPDLLRLKAKVYSSQNQNETARVTYMRLAELLTASEDVEGALNAYCDILTLIPDEEDRLSALIEAIQPGALSEISKKAQQKRELLEKEEESLREANELAKEESKSEPKDQFKTAPPPTQKVEKVVHTNIDRKEADGAFDLGKVYEQTGLEEEAMTEFLKAKSIYNSCIEAGIKDSIILERLAYLNSISGEIKKEQAQKEQEQNKKKKISFV